MNDIKSVRRPCGECPFKRTSLEGWLGPWTPSELLRQIEVEALACHMTVDSTTIGWQDPDIKLCAGATIFLNNKVALSRNHQVQQHQQMLKNTTPDVKDSVFKSSTEFMKHHD